MHFQRKLHDAFEGKSVAVRARRAAFDVVAEADAEIARLQAQVDALADALVSAVDAMDLVEDSILGAQRKRKPDPDGWYSEQMHKDEMDRVTQTKKQCEKALDSAGR